MCVYTENVYRHRYRHRYRYRYRLDIDVDIDIDMQYVVPVWAPGLEATISTFGLRELGT